MNNFTGCKKGLHPLKTILRIPQAFDTERVVRWCPECGAIVVDMDYDGRTKPGHYMKMQLPNITKNIV